MTDDRKDISNNPDQDSDTSGDSNAEDEILEGRREFLIGLGKWSKAVIAGAVLGTGALTTDRKAMAGWINRRGGWRGGSWINGGGGWINGGGGGGWINGGGGGWINRRGGGGWINRR